jgi:hypothetical protein
MTTIHLLIEDDYVETFMAELPKDKISVIEEDFKQNQKKLHNVLDEYKNHKSLFIPFGDSMKDLNSWLAKKEL